MTINCEVTLPPLEEIAAKLNSSMNSILLAAGQNLAKCIRNHMRQLNASRHSPLSNGRSSNHFTPNKVLEPTVDGDSTNVVVAIPGITRAYNDIDIYPVEANALAIPLHASAYGISPREISDRGTYQLFRIKRDGVPGNVLYRNEDDELIPMYALTMHVHQVRDPSLMPTDDEMTTASVNGVESALKTIFR